MAQHSKSINKYVEDSCLPCKAPALFAQVCIIVLIFYMVEAVGATRFAKKGTSVKCIWALTRNGRLSQCFR